MRVAVVGAGIVGAAATYELLKRGHAVTCFERSTPFSQRSKGDSRIFRLAHADPALVQLAAVAREGWRHWSREAGQDLVDQAGLVITGNTAQDWGRAMASAGAQHSWHAKAQPSWNLPTSDLIRDALFDPGAGVINARATADFLVERVDHCVVRDEVLGIHELNSEVVVEASEITAGYDRVLVVAGDGTRELGRAVAVPQARRRHSRFTFRRAEGVQPPVPWIDAREEWRPGFCCYSHTTPEGFWTIGGELSEEDTQWDLGESEVERRSREVVRAYVREQLLGVDDEVVDVINCDLLPMPGSDGFQTQQRNKVLYLWGHNLYKFAPALGVRLAGLLAC